MTSIHTGLIYEDLMIKDSFSEKRSRLFNNKTLNLVRKGKNRTFGDFELMNLKNNPEVF